jgi:Ser/Thr protein kinase RdoA (MazF antagonist)
MDAHADLPTILAAFGLAPGAPVSPVEGGLINRTFLIEAPGRRLVLQRVNPIFAPAVHLDIEAITAHLEAQGLLTPRLLPTTTGELCFRDAEGATWRILSYLPGRTIHAVSAPAVAAAAAGLVARFHRAVSGLEHRFHFSRPGAHDTPAHLARLAQALEEKRGHPRYDEVARVAERILAAARGLPPLPDRPLRIIHGDLKISNLRFSEDLTEARALLDLDTLARLTIPIELGDAFRSWCNPAGEDEPGAGFDAEIFGAAVRGYAGAAPGLLAREEIEALVSGAQTIALELAARFCADALYESYFGWNPQKFPSRSEHNRVRALSQLGVASSALAQQKALEAAVRGAFA